MAKARVTKKWIKESYPNIITVPYCNLQCLLRMEEPSYYTAGVDGWHQDVYIINNSTVICTGYQPSSGKRLSYEVMREAERQANRIWDIRYDIGYDQVAKRLREVIEELCESEE